MIAPIQPQGSEAMERARPSQKVDDTPKARFQEILVDLSQAPDDTSADVLSTDAPFPLEEGEGIVTAVADISADDGHPELASQPFAGAAVPESADDIDPEAENAPNVAWRLATDDVPESQSDLIRRKSGAVEATDANPNALHTLRQDGVFDGPGLQPPALTEVEHAKIMPEVNGTFVERSRSEPAIQTGVVVTDNQADVSNNTLVSRSATSDILGAANILSVKLAGQANAAPTRHLQGLPPSQAPTQFADPVKLPLADLAAQFDVNDLGQMPTKPNATPPAFRPLVTGVGRSQISMPQFNVVSDTLSNLGGQGLFTEDATMGPRPVGGATLAAQSPLPAQPPVRPIMMQIIQVVPQLGQQAIEISLSPEELGTLRLSLTTAEGALTLSISADRSETLDLLRRHAADLSQEFSALGYESIEFQFQESGQNPPQSSSDTLTDDGAPAASDNEATPEGALRVLKVTQTGLDLRV